MALSFPTRGCTTDFSCIHEIFTNYGEEKPIEFEALSSQGVCFTYLKSSRSL